MPVRHGLLNTEVKEPVHLGDLGCFSFQNSKHLASGEGGAILEQ